MLSNHKIQTALDEIKEISRIDLVLYSDKGKPVAGTFVPEGDMEQAVLLFADSMAESQMAGGCHFFKIVVDGALEYVLLTCSSSEDAYMVGRLAACQIRNLAAAYMNSLTGIILCRIFCSEICWWSICTAKRRSCTLNRRSAWYL